MWSPHLICDTAHAADHSHHGHISRQVTIPKKHIWANLAAEKQPVEVLVITMDGVLGADWGVV